MSSSLKDKYADSICERLAAGETLREICKTEGYPAHPTVVLWTNEDPLFADRYARARSLGLEVLADELVQIADDGTNDYMDRQSQTGTQRCLDAENVNRSRLRIDTRKWLLSKLRPEKYGEYERIDMKADVSVAVSVADTLRARRAARLAETKAIEE